MAANDHLHRGQMKLFMTGTELKGAITGSIDRAPMQSMDDMWKRKTRESKSDQWHGGGTHASLKQHGWVGPGPGIHQRTKPGAIPEFDQEHFQVDDAHHRIAAAADIEKRSKGRRTVWIPTTNRSDVFIEARDMKPPKLDPDAM